MKQSNSKTDYNTESKESVDNYGFTQDILAKFIDQLEKRFIGRIASKNRDKVTLQLLADIFGIKDRQHILILREKYEEQMEGGDKT